MNREETKNLIRAMIDYFPSFKPSNISETVSVWSLVLDDQDYKKIQQALVMYTRQDESGFAPAPAKLIKLAQTIGREGQKSTEEHYIAIRKAISNSAYRSQEEYNKLDAIEQKAVGSPSQLYYWSQTEGDIDLIIRGDLMRRIDRYVQDKENYEALPSELKPLIGQVAERITLKIEHKPSERERLEGIDSVPAPMDWRNRI